MLALHDTTYLLAAVVVTRTHIGGAGACTIMMVSCSMYHVSCVMQHVSCVIHWLTGDQGSQDTRHPQQLHLEELPGRRLRGKGYVCAAVCGHDQWCGGGQDNRRASVCHGVLCVVRVVRVHSLRAFSSSSFLSSLSKSSLSPVLLLSCSPSLAHTLLRHRPPARRVAARILCHILMQQFHRVTRTRGAYRREDQGVDASAARLDTQVLLLRYAVDQLRVVGLRHTCGNTGMPACKHAAGQTGVKVGCLVLPGAAWLSGMLCNLVVRHAM